MTPTEFYQRLLGSGKLGEGTLFGPTQGGARIGTMSGPMNVTAAASDPHKGPFKMALENAVKAVTGPLSFMQPIANATAAETKRVGESADTALKAGATALLEGAGGITSGLRIGAAVIVIIIGVWLIVSIRKLF